MESVKSWTQANNFTYKFFDDSFFAFAPDWYREKVNNQIHLVTDLARLVATKQLHASGFDRVIWIDADVIIFDPANFVIPQDQAYGFGLEAWLNKKDEKFTVTISVHNAIMHFHAQNSFLDNYIDAVENIVRTAPETSLKHTAVGTDFLTAIHRRSPVPILASCALFSPMSVRAIANNKVKAIQATAARLSSPIVCANLCSTFRVGNEISKKEIEDGTYEDAIANLMNSKGEIFNQFIKSDRDSTTQKSFLKRVLFRKSL
jgi:hypothetical protein